jgi:2-polyprenyl-6-methoxyphenol hydroxylase-like FAD-dependent oxidoreductase
MRVIVIGAGIGGLATAVGLQRAGAEVTVLERAETLRPVGAGVSVFANGIRALEVVGLGDEFRAVTAPARQLQAGQRSPSGAWLSRTPGDAIDELRIAHRSDLQALLHDALVPGTIRLGCQAHEVRGRFVETCDHALEADLIVAADGIHSAVRASWGNDPGLRYSGYSAWRGITERPVQLHGEAGETWGHGERFGIAPLRDGRVYWFAVATMPPGTTFDDEFGEVVRRFSGWHSPITEILDSTPADAVFRHDIHDLARPLPSFARERTVLLGDAAHAMTPDLGQGANQALEDAATITRLLEPIASDDDPAIAAALARYDALRRPRTQAIARQARQVGAIAHLRAPAIRNVLLRALPPAVMAAGVRSVQRWLPPARMDH